MKKLVVLFCAVLLAASVIGQNVKNRSGFFTKISNQKEHFVQGINHNFPGFENKYKTTRPFPQLKEANALKQRLDSVVAPGYDKNEYFYDPSGNLVLDIYSEWENNHWRNIAKYDYSFDAGGNRIKDVTSYEENGEWAYFMKEEFAFDAMGNKTKNETFLWTNNDWENYYEKDEYTYDARGNQIQHLIYQWDNGQYTILQKEESAFDENNNQTQHIQYFWDGIQWLFWLKEEFMFDVGGAQTQSVSYNWENDLWVNASKIEFEFDSEGRNTHSLTSGWDGENWFNIEKYETVFDANENIIRYVYFEWNGINWVEAAKFEYQYDEAGNKILSRLIYFFEDQQITFYSEESVYDDFGNRNSWTYFAIDDESEDFLLVPMMKQEYAYDNSFSFEDLILPFAADDFEEDEENDIDGEPGPGTLNLLFKHKLTNLTSYEGSGNGWLLMGDYMLYYSEQFVTGAENLKMANHLGVYPNPAINQVTFNVEDAVSTLNVELHDIHGKLVLSRLITNNEPVSIGMLNEGLYFYRVSDKSNFFTGKLMVKK